MHKTAEAQSERVQPTATHLFGGSADTTIDFSNMFLLCVNIQVIVYL